MQRLKELQDANKERTKGVEKMAELDNDVTDDFVKNSQKQAQAAYDLMMLKKKIDNEEVESKKKTQQLVLSATGRFASALSGLAEENKQLAAAGALIDTYAAVQQVMADKTIPSTTLKFIMAGTVVAQGLSNVKKIFAVGGGGGGSVPSPDAGTPAPQMLSGKFELGGTPEPQPVQAYVVTDSLTDNQNKLAYIRRRATI